MEFGTRRDECAGGYQYRGRQAWRQGVEDNMRVYRESEGKFVVHYIDGKWVVAWARNITTHDHSICTPIGESEADMIADALNRQRK